MAKLAEDLENQGKPQAALRAYAVLYLTSPREPGQRGIALKVARLWRTNWSQIRPLLPWLDMPSLVQLLLPCPFTKKPASP